MIVFRKDPSLPIANQPKRKGINMKRAILASILGLAGLLAMVATSNAGGSIYFQNYASGAERFYAPVTFGSSGQAVNGGTTTVAGFGVGSEFTADLLYSLNGFSYTLLTQANSGASTAGFGGYPVPFGFFSSTVDGPLPSAGSVYSSGIAPGYFFGGAVEIPSYTSGPITFIVEAYNGSSYAASEGAGMWRGQSAPFTIPELATGIQPPGFMTTMQPFAFFSIPEPTTLALGGLGLAALMLFRRRLA
ncbi:MAG TPA: PEP-CTERM sorting domain-containing protein [Candidatus Limnocylindrales bacterium]|nr:PEP-CTERM sorting domain-containing protein [Candidatus Limnocylindrales bacterium]